MQAEISAAKSRIYVLFDSWGSKHEKLGILGVIVHFVNSKYEVVTRLIGLSKLPGHSKTSISK